MYLVVGLGNPGKKYEKTRHNVGFLALDAFAKEHSFPEFTLVKKHTSFVSEGVLSETKVVLAKPQTFMNNSGKAVASLVSLSLGKLSETKELVVVHDDIDIPLGKVKVSESRGSAGHKGVDSIIQTLGTKNFTRVRIGIQPEGEKPNDVDIFVLQPLVKEELKSLKSSIVAATQILFALLKK